jgi:hypothetical protein
VPRTGSSSRIRARVKLEVNDRVYVNVAVKDNVCRRRRRTAMARSTSAVDLEVVNDPG